MFTSLHPQCERTAPSPRRCLAALSGALGAALVLTTAMPALAQTKGPSSSATPYVLPLVPEFKTTSIFTVGDSVNAKSDGVTPQRMVGIPDGLGAFDNGDGTFSVLMNHELNSAVGAVRDHGAIGAFVARYTIDKKTLQVLKVSDLIQQVALYNAATGSYNAPVKGVAFSRLCSADLPPAGAFAGGEGGYKGRIFMNGEETGAEGRALAHVVDGPDAGTTYELPHLGKFSRENSLTHPSTGAKTVVIGTDDGSGGQLYLYLGTKRNIGNPVERAGLVGGTLYGIKVEGVAVEDRNTPPASGTAFTLASLGDVSTKSGAQLESESVTAGVTSFFRPEDGSWDPSNPNRFYFVTTDRFDTVKSGQGNQIGRSRMWRLNFKDASDPTQGGTIDLILDGTGDYQMFDNITVDKSGHVLVQEDPGNQAYTARIQEVSGGTIRAIAQHDPARFGSLTQPPTAPFTFDEESSGIIDISDILGRRAFLFDVQAHYPIGDPELVEGGQLLLLELNDNQAPTVEAVFDPAVLKTSDLARVKTIISNPSGSEVTTTYTFSVNGKVVQTGTSNALNLSLPGFGDKGDIVSCEVTVTNTDGGVGKATVSSTIVNSDPTGISGRGEAESGVEKSFVLKGFDADGDAIHFSIASGPTNGKAEIRLDTNDKVRKLFYRSNPRYKGVDVIRFTVAEMDGKESSVSTFAISVKDTAPPANRAPIAGDTFVDTYVGEPVVKGLLGSDPDGDEMTFRIVNNAKYGSSEIKRDSDGKFKLFYTSLNRFYGNDTVTYLAVDSKGAQSNVATVGINFINRAPVAQGNKIGVASGVEVSQYLFGTDADGDALTFRLVNNPRYGKGEVKLDPQGKWRVYYTSLPGYVGPDRITFIAIDPMGKESQVAAVDINVVRVSGSASGALQRGVAPSGGGA